MSDTTTPWGTKLFFEVSSAAPDADPVWVDLTARVLSVGQPLEIGEGRQTELSDVDPARFTVQLRNRDGHLTPGNPLSEYVAWWKQRRRCRFREIVGYLGFDLFDGFLEIPENLALTQVPEDTDNDVTLFVSGIDLLGWFQQGRKLISTLGEYILYQGRQTGTLKGYYPLIGYPPFRSEIDRRYLMESVEFGTAGAARNVAGGRATYGAAPIAPGDDATSVDFNPDGTDPLQFRGSFLESRSGSHPVADTDVVTCVFWLSVDSYPFTGGSIVTCQGSGSTLSFGWNTVGMYGDFTLDGKLDTNTIAPALLPTGWPCMVALRMRKSPELCQLVINDQIYTGAFSGSFAGISMTTGDLTLGYGLDGRLNHVQVHVGPEADFGLTHLAAQLQAGLGGLEGQSTGQRIHTILDYAGVAAYQRDIDPGVSVMSQAQLAGASVQQALDTARDTEQGRLFAHAGRVVFHDRRRIYNV